MEDETDSRPGGLADESPSRYNRPVHGSFSRYKAGCRCPLCRERAAFVSRRRRQRAAVSGFVGREHGTLSTYGLGCKCPPCREAKRLYVRQWKAAKEAAK